MSYSVDVPDSYRRSIRAYFGKDGLATRAEVKQWLEMHGSSKDDDLSSMYSGEASTSPGGGSGRLPMAERPVEDSPMWWRNQSHDHVVAGDRDKAGPPFCSLCWVELDPLTHEPKEQAGGNDA